MYLQVCFKTAHKIQILSSFSPRWYSKLHHNLLNILPPQKLLQRRDIDHPSFKKLPQNDQLVFYHLLLRRESRVLNRIYEPDKEYGYDGFGMRFGCDGSEVVAAVGGGHGMVDGEEAVNGVGWGDGWMDRKLGGAGR